MKRALLVVALFATTFTLPSAAQVVYENGPINGTVDAWTINFGFFVADSFTVSGGPSTLSGLTFGAWLFPGDVLQSVEVSVTSNPISGTVYFDGIVSFTQSACSGNQYGFNVCTETGAFNGPTLQNGSYWINLQNAVVNSGDPVYWDENSGEGCHSPGCPSTGAETSLGGSIPSEAFTILGSNGQSTVPEPSSLMLFAAGGLGVAGAVRKRLAR
jgi:hypothetical protein